MRAGIEFVMNLFWRSDNLVLLLLIVLLSVTVVSITDAYVSRRPDWLRDAVRLALLVISIPLLNYDQVKQRVWKYLIGVTIAFGLAYVGQMWIHFNWPVPNPANVGVVCTPKLITVDLTKLTESERLSAGLVSFRRYGVEWTAETPLYPIREEMFHHAFTAEEIQMLGGPDQLAVNFHDQFRQEVTFFKRPVDCK